MKKLSISLFALLAIIFAATSAFTTKVDKTFDPEFWVFSSSQPDVPGGNENAQYIALELAGGYVEESAAGYADLAEFLDDKDDEDFICSGGDDVCVAYVDNDLEEVIAIEDGLYDPL